MENILLSIIIPAYNVANYITDTLELFMNQNLNQCEVIVVNDGSNDNTNELVKKFTELDSRIKLITQENQGVSTARNRGINIASGKYIYFMDADDSLETGTLDFFREVLSNPRNVDIYSFGFKRILNGIETIYTNLLLNDIEFDRESFLKNYFTYKVRIHICSCIYSKEFIEKNQLEFIPGVKIDEDTVFILEALKKSNSIFFSSRLCYIYKIRDDSVMKGYKVYDQSRINATKMVVDKTRNLYSTDSALYKYMNFYLCKRIVGHYFAYMKSDCNDEMITSDFIILLKNLKEKIVIGDFKTWFALTICKFLPLSLLLQIKKKIRS